MIFRSELAIAILRGQKTATRRPVNFDNPRAMWRFERPWRYPVGQGFAVQPGRGAPRVADAEVTDRWVEPLCAITAAEARREGLPTRQAFIDTITAIHGSYDPYQRVHVVEFKLTTPACATCGGWRWRDVPFGCKIIPSTCTTCLGTGLVLNDAARHLLTHVST